MEKKFPISIDLKRNLVQTISGFKQGDNNDVLYIKLLQDSLAYDLTNLTVRLNFERADGLDYYQDSSKGVTITNAVKGELKVTILSEVLDVDSTVKADISVFEGQNKISSGTFIMVVGTSIYSEDALVNRQGGDLLYDLATREQQRIVDENNRLSAEEVRVASEDTRVSAENDRKTKYTQIEQQWANVQAAAGNSNIGSSVVTEVVSARVEPDGTNYPTVGDRLDYLTNKVKDPILAQVNTNLNQVVSLPNSIAGIGNIQTIEGRTVVNLLGDAGDCEDLSKFGTAGGPILDSSLKLYGSNSIKCVASANKSYISKDITCDPTHKYLLSAYAYISAYTSGAAYIIGWDYGTWNNAVNIPFNNALINQWQRKSVVLSGRSAGGFKLGIGASDVSTMTINLDGIMLYDLTMIYGIGNEPTDVTKLETELPFINNIKGVLPSSIKTVSTYEESKIDLTGITSELNSIFNGDRDAIDFLKQKQIKKVSDQISLTGALNFTFPSAYTTCVRVLIAASNFTNVKFVDVHPIFELYLSNSRSSLPITNSATQDSGDYSYFDSNNLAIFISYGLSGWNSGYTPTTDEVKAYFYGWKMCKSDGTAWDGVATKYWKKITDGSGVTSILPTASYTGYIPYVLRYQLATPVETPINLDNALENYQNGTLQVESNIPCNVIYNYPTNLASAIKALGTAVDKNSNNLTNALKSIGSVTDTVTKMRTYKDVNLVSLATAGAIATLALEDNTVYLVNGGNNITINAVDVSKMTDYGLIYFADFTGGAGSLTIKTGSTVFLPSGTNLVLNKANGKDELLIPFMRYHGAIRKVGL